MSDDFSRSWLSVFDLPSTHSGEDEETDVAEHTVAKQLKIKLKFKDNTMRELTIDEVDEVAGSTTEEDEGTYRFV